MVGVILFLLIISWILGYISIPGLNIPNLQLFNFNGHIITLWGLLILILIASLIEILPSPLKQISGFILLLWLLSLIGVISIAGLPNIIVISVIIGLVFFILGLV